MLYGHPRSGANRGFEKPEAEHHGRDPLQRAREIERQREHARPVHPQPGEQNPTLDVEQKRCDFRPGRLRVA
jgi:hypothetical protein